MQHFLNYMGTIQNKSDNTIYHYASDISGFLKFLKYKSSSDNIPIDKIPINNLDDEFFKKIDRECILEYLYYLKNERKNAPSSRARRLCAIRKFFNYLYEVKKLIPNNPAYGIDLPKLDKKVPIYLDMEQCQKLLSNLKSSFYKRDYLIIVLFLNTGIRLQELISIDLTDIQSDYTLRIRGKGSKERIVYLNEVCQKSLTEYLEARASLPCQIVDKEALFISDRTGHRITPRRVEQIVDKAFESANLEGYTTHKLRHTAATNMYQNKVDIRVIKEVLGHESLATTQIYTHTTNQQLKDAYEVSPIGLKKE